MERYLRWDRHLHEFEGEMARIINTHRYLIRVSERDFREAFQKFIAAHDLEHYDGGDAIWDAEEQLGVEPSEVSQHAGLMALTRAISLSEVTLARMASAWMTDPKKIAFINSRSWTRAWEESFYKSCPPEPFHTASNGFGALRDLRDLYVHGYGEPHTEDRRQSLARKLHDALGDTEPTDEEKALGYRGAASYFSEYANYDRDNDSFIGTFITDRNANLSPLSTYRSLLRIREHITAASKSLDRGVKKNLSAENSRFVREFEKREKKIAEAKAKG